MKLLFFRATLQSWNRCLKSWTEFLKLDSEKQPYFISLRSGTLAQNEFGYWQLCPNKPLPTQAPLILVFPCFPVSWNIFCGTQGNIDINWSMCTKCLSRPYHFKFFKGCLPQILLGPFMNMLTHGEVVSLEGRDLERFPNFKCFPGVSVKKIAAAWLL